MAFTGQESERKHKKRELFLRYVHYKSFKCLKCAFCTVFRFSALCFVLRLNCILNLRDCGLDCDVFNVIVILNLS